ncbi:MAG: hypothetical protein GY861_24400 [bacterium]|nr:hypothetical protein [bacterium]
MAVVQATIKAELNAIYAQMSNPGDIKSEDWFADQMATVIRNAILSASIITSTPGAQTGPTTLPGIGTIS